MTLVPELEDEMGSVVKTKYKPHISAPGLQISKKIAPRLGYTEFPKVMETTEGITGLRLVEHNPEQHRGPLTTDNEDYEEL